MHENVNRSQKKKKDKQSNEQHDTIGKSSEMTSADVCSHNIDQQLSFSTATPLDFSLLSLRRWLYFISSTNRLQDTGWLYSPTYMYLHVYVFYLFNVVRKPPRARWVCTGAEKD